MKVDVSWQGVIVFVSLVAGAVVSAVFHQNEVAMLLAGAAAGHLAPLPGPVAVTQGP